MFLSTIKCGQTMDGSRDIYACFYKSLMISHSLLYKEDANQISFLLVTNHLLSLPQQMGMVLLNGQTILSDQFYKRFELEKESVEIIVPSILLKLENRITFTNNFLAIFEDRKRIEAIIVTKKVTASQNQPSAPSTGANKSKVFKIANHLFGIDGQGRGYDFKSGADLVEKLLAHGEPLEALGAEIIGSGRKPLAVDEKAVRLAITEFKEPKRSVDQIRNNVDVVKENYRKMELKIE